MHRLSIDFLRPEMIAAAEVLDPQGRVLIRAGGAIQESHIKALVETLQGVKPSVREVFA